MNVIHITWQVETKLTTWFGRRKYSDFLDLVFLLTTYSREITKWSKFLDKNMRDRFYHVYSSGEENETRREIVKKILSL